MSSQNVYELRPVLDTPGYKCFGLRDGRSLTGGHTFIDDFFPADVSKRTWKIRRLASVWKPPIVLNPLPGQIHDFPCIGLHVPTFSRRAAGVLNDFLSANGELLPLDSEECSESYWAFNCTTVADVLDRERSDVVWMPRDRLKLKKGLSVELVVADDIYRYVFDESKLAGLSIFRLVERPFRPLLVVEEFAKRIRANDLKGFDLRKVYPCPPRTVSRPGHW